MFKGGGWTLTLHRSGFDVKKLSLVGRGHRSQEHAAGFYTGTNPLQPLESAGAFWGNVWGLLVEPALFFLPGLGLMAMAGPITSALVDGLGGAEIVEDATALGSTLSRIGLAKDEVNAYESALRADKYVLMVHGNAKEADRARAILSSAKAWEEA